MKQPKPATVTLSPAELDLLIEILTSGLQSDTVSPSEGNDPEVALRDWRAFRPQYVSHGMQEEPEFGIDGHEATRDAIDLEAGLLERLILLRPEPVLA